MTSKAVLRVRKLGFPWETADPFLFCVHHDDQYPAGNARLGPASSLSGRTLGQDFEGKEGWRMYHGDVVPGFPQHPHRGFETITIVREGLVDHSDSLGATARFGHGDVQWLTAGKGIVHAEMFPLVHSDHRNPLELFQIWLNLPAADKMAEPHFSMFWSRQVPRRQNVDDRGRKTEVTVIAGRLGDARAPAPPPRSWASRKEAEVAIWTLRMDPGATFVLPPASRRVNRTLYLFKGGDLDVDGTALPPQHGADLRADAALPLVNTGAGAAEVLVLQGRPIGEPVVQYGPFVMNTQEEIRQALVDFRQTGFGGWPWPVDDPVHPKEAGRFARHIDGRFDHA